MERQADQLVMMAEDLGKTRAERDAAQAAHASILAAQTTPASVESPLAVWRRLWLLALAVAGVVVIVLMLFWSR